MIRFVYLAIFLSTSNSFAFYQSHLDKENVCLRTKAIRVEIQRQAQKPCEEVDSEDLSKIRILNLNDETMDSLNHWDFQGMTSLSVIHFGNNQISELPVGIFTGLKKITFIDFQGSKKLKHISPLIFDEMHFESEEWPYLLINRNYMSNESIEMLYTQKVIPNFC